MPKRKPQKTQRGRPEAPQLQPAKSARGQRAETIALALEQATSPAGRERARAHINSCGSPIMAAKDVFLSYAQAAEQSDPRYAVACHAGCWFCCTIPVAVTVFEAAMVRSAVHALPEEQQQLIWGRLQDQIAAQDQKFADSDAERVPFHRRCPLLNDEGQCSVYEGRPLACRSLLSLDAERCRRMFLEDDPGDPNTPYTLTNNPAISGVLQLMVTLNEGNLDHYPSYELSSALYKIWAEPASFMAWQRGERFAEHGFPRMAEGDQIYPAPEGLPIGPPR